MAAEPTGHNDRGLIEDGSRMVAVFRRQDAREWETFLAAAPDMARALMRRLDGCANTGSRVRGCEEEEMPHLCASCEAKAALRKAGVLP